MSDHSPEEFGANQGFIEDLYAAYLADRTTVGPQWRELFRRWEDEGREATAGSRLPAPDPQTAAAQIDVHASSDSRQTVEAVSVARADLPPRPAQPLNPR